MLIKIMNDAGYHEFTMHSEMDSKENRKNVKNTQENSLILESGISHLLQSNSFFDLKIVLACGKILHLHQLLFAACSADFLYPLFVEGQHEDLITIIMPDFEEAEVIKVVKYLYGIIDDQEVPLTTSIVQVLRLGNWTGFREEKLLSENLARKRIYFRERHATKKGCVSESSFTPSKSNCLSSHFHQKRPRPNRSKNSTVHSDIARSDQIELDIACVFCDLTFRSKSSYYYHLQKHKEHPSFTCLKCGKIFKSKRGLLYHTNIHNGKLDYQCEDCGRSFVTKQKLLNHQRAKHTLERPFTCENCGKGFTRSDKLKIHLRRAHTGEKPYSCHLCDWRGVDSSGLIHHKKKKHTPNRDL